MAVGIEIASLLSKCKFNWFFKSFTVFFSTSSFYIHSLSFHGKIICFFLSYHYFKFSEDKNRGKLSNFQLWIGAAALLLIGPEYMLAYAFLRAFSVFIWLKIAISGVFNDPPCDEFDVAAIVDEINCRKCSFMRFLSAMMTSVSSVFGVDDLTIYWKYLLFRFQF